MLKPSVSLWSKELDLPGFSPMLEKLREYKPFNISSDVWPSNRWEFPWALAFLGDKPQHILNVNGGYDPFSLLLKDLGHSVMVIREHGPSSNATNKLFAKKNIGLIEHDMCDCPFQDEEFDVVFCLSYLQYLDEDRARKMVEEMLRVIKPGKQCVITVCDTENTKWLVPDFEPPDDVIMTYSGSPIAGVVFEKEE